MRFVVEQLYRVTHPGCNVCIHVQQLLAYINQHGFQGRRNFRDGMIEVFSAGGFAWTGEFVIPKNPQSMAQRLNLHSLQFKTGYARHSGDLAPAVNDYVLIFHKLGEPETPCRPLIHRTNPNGWMHTDEWVRDASGIWSDIMEIDVLDGASSKWKRSVKEDKHEKHVCPLQLGVILRLINLYTNPISLQPNVTVLDPFMGIGSTAWVALGGRSPVTKQKLKEPRNVVGFELKESYYRAALDNAKKAMRDSEKPKDLMLF